MSSFVDYFVIVES